MRLGTDVNFATLWHARMNQQTEAERLFHALAEGGQVQMPLAETFFSPRFGMVADRFGVSWMVYVVPAEPAS